MEKCMICGKEFKNLNGVSKHLSKRHKEMSTKKYYGKYLKEDYEGICLECGSKTTFISLASGYHTFCSRKCSNTNSIVKEKIRNTTIKNFGNIGYASKEILDKCEDTCLQKYGFKQASKHYKVKETIRNTFQTKYKKNSPSQVPEFVKKQIDSCLKNFGKDNPMKTAKFVLKQKNSRIKNYLPKVLDLLEKLDLILISKFEDSGKEIIVKCKKCNNIFNTTFFNLYQGCGKCKICYPASKSISQVEIEKWISNEFSDLFFLSNDRKIIKPQELDIYIPDLKIAFEYNGLYWHSEKYGCGKEYHMKKTLKCEKLGIRLVHIFEDEWILGKENLKMILRKIIKEDWDFLPDYDFHSISLNRRFCKSSEYYEKLGFKVKIINPKLYLNKENFKVWDCGFLELTKL